MTSTSSIPDLHGAVTVNLSAEHAFAFFTGSMTRWWPAEYHIGQAAMVETLIEPSEGGRWYERGDDGSECDWGRVKVWDPPRRLVVTWQINGHWQFDQNPDHASEIEVRFTASGAEQTIVELEHRHLDRLVEGRTMRDQIVEAGGGWSSVLQVFAAVATGDPHRLPPG